MEGKLLSQRGCLVLIRHVVSSMATHTIAVLPVPIMILKKINSILSIFLQEESNDGGKMKWCAWSKVCNPVEEGSQY